MGLWLVSAFSESMLKLVNSSFKLMNEVLQVGDGGICDGRHDEEKQKERT